MKSLALVACLSVITVSAHAQQRTYQYRYYGAPQPPGVVYSQPYSNGRVFQPAPQYVLPQQPLNRPPHIDPRVAAEQMYRLQQPFTEPLRSLRWQYRCFNTGQCYYFHN